MRPFSPLSTLITHAALATALSLGIGGTAVASASPAAAVTPLQYPELTLQMSIGDVGAKLAEAYGTKSVSLSACILNPEGEEPVEICFVNDERDSFQKTHILTFQKDRLVASMFTITWTGEDNAQIQQQYLAIAAKLEKAYGKPQANSLKAPLRLEWMMDEHQWVGLTHKDKFVLVSLSQYPVTSPKNRLPMPGSAFRRAWAYLDPRPSDELTLGMTTKFVEVINNPTFDVLSRPRTAPATPATALPDAFATLKLNMSVEEAGRKLTGAYGQNVLRDIECVHRIRGKDTLETCTLLAGFQKVGQARAHATQMLMFKNDALIGSYFLMNTTTSAAPPLDKKQVSAVIAGITSRHGPGRAADVLGDAIYSWRLANTQHLTAMHQDEVLTLMLYDKAQLTQVARHDWSRVSATVRKPWAAPPAVPAQATKPK